MSIRIKILITVINLVLLTVFASTSSGAEVGGLASSGNDGKVRMLVVSSYHRDFPWSISTNRGLVEALIEFNYLDTPSQGDVYTEKDFVESSRSVIKKLWMDTKRRNSQSDIALTLRRVITEIDAFNPDIILLGDDNAANYVGNQYIDSGIPVVFWGVNGTPLKYGLIDSIERPGHNVTGIYQGGHILRAVKSLQRLVPGIKRMAILSDDSPTGRTHAKQVKRFSDQDALDVELVEVVITNSYSEWKAKALELQQKVDAFYMSLHHTLRDDDGRPVDHKDAAGWYLKNILKPEVAPARYMVEGGMLCVVVDSGYQQGYQGVKMAHQILSQAAEPATMKPFSPEHGPFVVNRKRAKVLGLTERLVSQAKIIDEIIE